MTAETPVTQEPQSIQVDKLASVLVGMNLGHTLQVAQITEPKVGDVVVIRTLTDNSSYNKLELTSGRQARIKVGDVIAGVLGRRRALKGFVGDVPKKVQIGDQLHLLNLGGLVGKCSGRFQKLGRPIKVEVLGAVIDAEGKPMNLSQVALTPVETLEKSVPLILVAGTSMAVGKTQVVAELTKQFTRHGYHVAGAKLSGVAAMRDLLDMEDHGARKTLGFVNCGLPSTVGLKDLGPIAKTILHHLNQDNPDVIVVEMGDGLIGGYNVDSIFKHKDLMDKISAVLLCAPDFVGVHGGVSLLNDMGVKVDVVSGPATDSKMGVNLIQKRFSLPSANAINDGASLFKLVEARIKAFKGEA